MFLVFLLLSSLAEAKTIKVAVIDTGFDMQSTWPEFKKEFTRPKLCKTGHFNFSNNTTDVMDNHGHGTHIAGLIGRYNEKVDYCLIIFKYYEEYNSGLQNMMGTLSSFRKAIEYKVDIINYSGGGTLKSEVECNIMKEALDAGIKVVAAAGNENSDLSRKPYYPAMCDPRIIKVMNIKDDGERSSLSNYDRSEKIENIIKIKGERILSLAPNDKLAIMTGTSQATAIATRNFIKELAKGK